MQFGVAEFEFELVAATSFQDPNAWFLSRLQSTPDFSSLQSVELGVEQVVVSWLAVHILPKCRIHV